MEQKENLAHTVKIKHKAEEISGQWQPLPCRLVPPSPRHPYPIVAVVFIGNVKSN